MKYSNMLYNTKSNLKNLLDTNQEWVPDFCFQLIYSNKDVIYQPTETTKKSQNKQKPGKTHKALDSRQ